MSGHRRIQTIIWRSHLTYLAAELLVAWRRLIARTRRSPYGPPPTFASVAPIIHPTGASTDTFGRWVYDRDSDGCRSARPSGSDWALAVEARSRALLSDRDTAERLYQEAIERLSRTRVRVQFARTHLLYGEWLRRERRRLDARDQLRTARELFTSMGAEAFAARAERELLATGERVRKRRIETRDELTAQESQIARLARDGLSNAEIGERLFISQHTAAYHLRKVFSKLDITSRNQLRQVLPDSAGAGQVA